MIYYSVINDKPIDFEKEKMPYGLKRFIENTYKKARKVDRMQPKSEIALSLVLFFSKFKYDYKATSIINKHIRDQDDKNKKEILKDMLKDKEKPFYMASWHKDSAADHADWQGKLYYDANAKGEALEYARNHNLKTLQWVTGSPVWFVTRPYCRHYFVQYSLEEVKKGVKPMTNKIGRRDLQTPARVSLDFYLDRLDGLERLNKVFPIPRLKRQIDKTKLLIKKWRGEI